MENDTAAGIDDSKQQRPFRMAGVGRQTVIYGAGVLFSRALSFLMLPLFTHYLTPADYGVIQLIEMTFDVISIVAGSRLALGIFRFYYKAETAAARQEVLSTSLILLVSMCAIVALITFALSAHASELLFQTSEYDHVIRIAAWSFACQSLVEVPLAHFRLVERASTYVKVTVGKLIFQAVLNLIFLAYLGLGVRGVFLSSLIAHALTGVVLAAQLIRATGFKFSRSAARDLLRFGLPLVLTQGATFIATYGDRYFLQAAAGTAVVGVYALAYNFGFLLFQIGHTPFALVWEPVRYEIAKRADRDQLYARGFIYLNLLLLSAAVAIALYVRDFLRIFAQPAYYPAANVVPVILAAYVLQSWTMIQDIGIMIRERTKYNTLANWTAAFVALVGYALLIPRYLGLGAALATVAAFAVRFGIIYIISQRLWPVKYRWGPAVRLVIIAGAAILAGALLPELPLATSVGARTMLFLIYLVGVWHLGIITKEDRSRISMLASPRAIRSRVSGLMGGVASGKP